MRSSQGVNKAGTTSLFVSLSTHPDVAPSSVKETRLLPPGALRAATRAVRRSRTYFADAGDRPVHLEATPDVLLRRRGRRRSDARRGWSNPHALVVLREPVSRAISFFTYQKIRLRFPAD